MDKNEIEKIRPEVRELVIKSYIIKLSHQLYRDIWWKLTIVIIAMQMGLAFGSTFLKYVCNIDSISTTIAGAIYSWACCMLVIIGSFISRKAMDKAQETKNMLYKLIDSYTNIIKTPDEVEREEYEDEE